MIKNTNLLFVRLFVKFVLFCFRVSCCEYFRWCWWFVFSLDSIGVSLFSWFASNLDSFIVSTECTEQATSISKTNYLEKSIDFIKIFVLQFKKKSNEMRWDETYLNQSNCHSNASQNGWFWAQQREQNRFASLVWSNIFNALLIFGQIEAARFWQIGAI